jgi:lipopolysaccharide exporter
MFVASATRVWAGYALFPSGRHRFRRDRDVAADLWRFSRVIALSSALTLVATQADKLAMARLLSLSEFGIFVIATSLAAAPAVFAFNYSSAIVYPAAAEAWRNGSSLADAYYRCWGRFFYLYLFGGGVLIGIADLLVRLLYDPRYLAAGNYLSILAVSTSLAIATRGMEAVHVASGRTLVGVQLNICRLAWLIAGGIWAFVRWEPMIFVLTIGLVEVPAYAFGLWQTARFHGVRWARELSLALVLASGFVVGEAASQIGLRLFPNL